MNRWRRALRQGCEVPTRSPGDQRLSVVRSPNRRHRMYPVWHPFSAKPEVECDTARVAPGRRFDCSAGPHRHWRLMPDAGFLLAARQHERPAGTPRAALRHKQPPGWRSRWVHSMKRNLAGESVGSIARPRAIHPLRWPIVGRSCGAWLHFLVGARDADRESMVGPSARSHHQTSGDIAVGADLQGAVSHRADRAQVPVPVGCRAEAGLIMALDKKKRAGGALEGDCLALTSCRPHCRPRRRQLRRPRWQ